MFKSSFGSVMPLAAAAAGAAVLKFGADSVAAFHESEAAMAQTNAVLKSTGGAANVTADEVLGLAQRLRDLSGADDEAIQASENLLLTFTKVRNEAGAGNDIFNQGTEAILDMATAMNNGVIPSMEDLNSKTILVGKALQDPIKGLTALGRAGVQFTEQQKDQIEAMVAAGDTMGAQKIILAELETQFGGAARAAGDTFAGAQAKAAQKVEDLQEKIGGILVPVIAELSESFADILTHAEPLITFIGTAFAGAVEIAADNLEDMLGPIETLLDLIPDLGAKTDEGGASFMDYAGAIANIGNPISLVADPMSKLHDITSIVTGDFEDQQDVLGEQTPVMQSVEAAARSMYERFQEGTQVTSDTETATRHLTDAMRDQRLATLALTDSFLGIVDSATAVSDAQRELNRLERAGRDDTKAYEAAVLDALAAQIGLEDAVLSYGQELAESGETAREVKQKVRELGDQFGIQDSIIDDLIQQVLAYIRELNNIPSSVSTQVLMEGIGGNIPDLQHGGIVTRPTLAMIGEAGPEAVVPLSRGRMGVSSVMDSQTADEIGRALARYIRLEPIVVDIDGRVISVMGRLGLSRSGL